MQEAKISEIFFSIQGEGIYTGTKQIFIRFYGCNLSCLFCDTNPSIYKEYSVSDLLDEISHLKEDHHSISITGGEPLLQKDFLRKFLPLLKETEEKIYLETNGTLPQALEEIIDFIDIIAMDFKLSSSAGTKDLWQVHKRFLRKAAGREVFVKAVVTRSTTEDDIKKACNIIADIDRNITLVLQPVTPVGRVEAAGSSRLTDLQRLCLNRLKAVRIIPQLHKMVGVR
jgi:7-carboxy-7-deazaguanine synthase